MSHDTLTLCPKKLKKKTKTTLLVINFEMGSGKV